MSQQEMTNSADSVLRELDEIIQLIRVEGLNSKEQNKLKERTFHCILSIVGYSHDNDKDLEEQALDVVASDKIIEHRKLLAISILRLLPGLGTKWFGEPPWRPKVVTLLESQLSEDFYREQRIDIQSMSHEKVIRLATVINEYENQQFIGALELFTSLDRMQAHREKLMKVLNNKTGRTIIYPFLPNNIEAKLGEFYKRVEIYLERRADLGVVDAYSGAIQEAKKFIHQLESSGTFFSMKLATCVGKRLLGLIQEDFANNRAAQPAALNVRIRDKKYPFHLVGQTISLGFIVNNLGPGYAYQSSIRIISENNLEIFTDEIILGRMAPNADQLVEIPARVMEISEGVDVILEINWRNFDGMEQEKIILLTFDAQKSNVPWEELAQSDPYSLEPVITENELVGRRATLNRLIATIQASTVGSSIVHGQKRVGKTSIAKTLQSHLENLGHIVIYLEGGDYVEPSAVSTISRLGTKLCRAIINIDNRTASLAIPNFSGSISPLVDFLDDVSQICPERRIIIILDEFDELPLDLYTRADLGNSFFLTLRSISSRPKIGFVLVGGEKMSHVLECQGSNLNKWSSVPVDYFTRESDWSDYKELVQRPVLDTIEYTEDALITLHSITAGNPYFTKLICQSIFQEAVNRRDCYITASEIDQGVEKSLRETDRNTFQHFWEDGIFDTGERVTEKSIQRRKILIAVSDILVTYGAASETHIQTHSLIRDVSMLDSELREFISRKVLVSDPQLNTYNFKVKLFHKWLKERGVSDLIATFSNLDATLRAREEEERIKVSSWEVVNLVKYWHAYKGQAITEDKVRAWLEQFGGVREQRAMFNLLKGIRFYSDTIVRQKMSDVNDIVRRGLTRHIVHGKNQRVLKRSDILVSYLDSPAKSGAQFAKLFADEASIYVDNVVEKGELAAKLIEKNDTQVLVFVDDFVGTGQSISEYLQQLDSEIGDIIQSRDIKVFCVVVVAFKEGARRIEEAVNQLKMPVQFHKCEELDQSDKVFNSESSLFTDSTEREFARKIAQKHGKILEKDCPLGYGDLEAAVVFEQGCPNNSLPILWSESTNPRWVPLFKRH